MASFLIEGGHALTGSITPQGAKNEALQVICATLLTSEKVRISGVPDILDVNNLIQLLRDIGVKVTRYGPTDYEFQADGVNPDYLQSEEFLTRCTSLRGSILLMGPLLARFGRAIVAQPGGDKIGRAGSTRTSMDSNSSVPDLLMTPAANFSPSRLKS